LIIASLSERKRFKLSIRSKVRDFDGIYLISSNTVNKASNFEPFLASSVASLDELPSKPLTLDHMETLDLFFRRACYHQKASYRKMKRIKIVEKL
jgi:hypothetical protein